LANDMAALRASYWQQTQIPEDVWPHTTLMVAAAAPGGNHPRVWHLTFAKAQPEVKEILQMPHVHFEGKYKDVFTLLYGVEREILQALQQELDIPEAEFWDAFSRVKALRSVEKLSLAGMPIQDAIDLAVFIATTQVQMDRFLPGEPACGGPIDVMVLQTAPFPDIISFPGKRIHHPLLEH
jgi:hypothetical protein